MESPARVDMPRTNEVAAYCIQSGAGGSGPEEAVTFVKSCNDKGPLYFTLIYSALL